MAVRRVTAFSVEVDDQPGVLGEMAQHIADAGINLLAVMGVPSGEGKSAIRCVPDDPGKLRALAAEGGVAVEESELLLVEGDDVPGAAAAAGQKLGAAGININGIIGLTTAGKYALCICVGPDNVDKAVAALGG
jgi:hypothetical protein